MNRNKEGILEFDKRGGGTFVALLLAALPFWSACLADVQRGLVIVQNQTPETEKGCIIPSKATRRPVSEAYDVDLDRPYPFYFFPLLRNDFPVTEAEGTIEVNRIEYTGVEVKIVPPPGVVFPSTASCPAEFSFPERASLMPTVEISSMVQTFLPCHSAALRAMFKSGALPSDPSSEVRFKAVVRAVGRHGGDTIKSDPYEHVVRVCLGCLQRGFGDKFSQFDYPKIPACTAITDNPYKGNPCNPAQNSFILCCDQGGGKIQCPGQPVDPLTKI